MPEGYIRCSAGPPSMRQRGKPRVGIGGSMASLDLTDVRPKDDLAAPDGDYLAEDSLSMPAELWAPPLAPFGDEDAFLAPEPSRRKLIAGIAIVAALGAATLSYFFFLASSGTKPRAETAQTPPVASSATGVGSSSEVQVQAAPPVAEPSPGASRVVPSPEVPASLTAEASTQVAASAVAPQTTSTAQNPDFVFLQRPGVNIRSGPSGNAPVIGTVPKGTQLTATGREGDWVQVENTRLKGWISSQFLAPGKPQ
jgi:Bacterial SH3 domain